MGSEAYASGVINSEAISRAARKRPIRINREIRSSNLFEEVEGREGTSVCMKSMPSDLVDLTVQCCGLSPEQNCCPHHLLLPSRQYAS